MIFMLLEMIRGLLMPFPFWIKDTGKRGEYLARRHLHRSGYHCVDRNWRYHHGEIDIIMANDKHLLFVEVKTRSAQSEPNIAEQVKSTQKRRLIKLAHVYTARLKQDDLDWLFHLILVCYKPAWRKIEITRVPLS